MSVVSLIEPCVLPTEENENRFHATDATDATDATETIIRTYCPYHLGDHVYSFYLFNHLHQTGFLESTNSHIYYFFPATYHKQVQEFNQCPERIRIFDFTEKDDYSGEKYGYRLHTHNENLPLHMNNCGHRKFDKFYVDFFNQFLDLWVKPLVATNTTHMTIPPPPPPRIEKFEYVDPELCGSGGSGINRYENLPEEYKDLDVLIVNSTPRSYQYELNHIEWNLYIYGLIRAAKLRVATTEKVEGVICTTDANLTVKDIAAASTHAKVIIGISTGPLSGFFNTDTLENMRAMYVFQNDNTYITPRVEKKRYIWDIKMQDLYRMCRASSSLTFLPSQIILFDKMAAKKVAAAEEAVAAKEATRLAYMKEVARTYGLVNKMFPKKRRIRNFAERFATKK